MGTTTNGGYSNRCVDLLRKLGPMTQYEALRLWRRQKGEMYV